MADPGVIQAVILGDSVSDLSHQGRNTEKEFNSQVDCSLQNNRPQPINYGQLGEKTMV